MADATATTTPLRASQDGPNAHPTAIALPSHNTTRAWLAADCSDWSSWAVTPCSLEVARSQSPQATPPVPRNAHARSSIGRREVCGPSPTPQAPLSVSTGSVVARGSAGTLDQVNGHPEHHRDDDDDAAAHRRPCGSGGSHATECIQERTRIKNRNGTRRTRRPSVLPQLSTGESRGLSAGFPTPAPPSQKHAGLPASRFFQAAASLSASSWSCGATHARSSTCPATARMVETTIVTQPCTTRSCGNGAAIRPIDCST